MKWASTDSNQTRESKNIMGFTGLSHLSRTVLAQGIRWGGQEYHGTSESLSVRPGSGPARCVVLGEVF